MSKVAIVTDSTSTIPPAMLKGLDVHQASQVVIWDGETYKDQVDITPSEFYKRLAKSKTSPTTSQASAADFKIIFNKLIGEGYDILAIVISSKLSGTLNSVEQAKNDLPDANIEVVDSLSTSMAMGFIVLEAAKMAKNGATLAECKDFSEKAKANAGIVLAPDTLEYLHRGGRIGGGTRFLGTALNIRPILELVDGRIEPVERARTRKKVMKRLVELAVERIGDRKPVRIAALHATSEEDAKTILDMVKSELNPEQAILCEVSPAIGTHIGPGMIGLTFVAGF